MPALKWKVTNSLLLEAGMYGEGIFTGCWRGGAGQKSMGRDGAGQGSKSAGRSRADVVELANYIQLHNHDHNYCCHSVPLWAS